MKMKEKREYKKSELLDMIKDGFYEIENECSDIELGCFGDEDVESFYEFLISKHRDEWIVIDDESEKGGNYEGTF